MEADREVLGTVWAAAPLTHDFDGDEDLLVYSECFACYVEKPFLRHGNCSAAAAGAVEQRAR